MKNIKVSIVIPVYNGENFVVEAIESALNQTYKNIEIIVVDDGSTDSTEKICLGYFKQIKYIKKENGGVSSALNVGIKNMTGDYFSWLSHDDLYCPDKIEKQVEFLKHIKKNNIILYSDYMCINQKGKMFSKPVIIDKKEVAKKPLYALLRGYVNGITMLIPKKAFDEIGLFDEKLRCTQDYDLWWKMIQKYEFVPMSELITKTRIHCNQDTKKHPNVLIEGNKLWIHMIDHVDDETKIQYEGSIYNYYYQMAKFLYSTPYDESREYCINKCKKIDLTKYSSNPLKKPKYGLNKVIYYIKDYGIIVTMKKIFSKLF